MVRACRLLIFPVAAALGVHPRQDSNVSISAILSFSKGTRYEDSIITSTAHQLTGTSNAETTTSTRVANDTTTSGMRNASNTCCYIYPRGVGVNTWYSSTVDVTVATVITTWLKYNNTIVPGNFTTKTVVDTTSIYGLYQVPQYTLIPVSATSTATETACSGKATEGSKTCTDWRTATSTYSAYSTSFSYFNPLVNITTNLLPHDAWAYGETSIDPTGAVTFPSQTLTIHAPTPYFLFIEGLDVFTSTACQATKTYTDLSTEIWTSKDGGWKYVTTTFPTYTKTAFEGAAEDAPINSAVPANLVFNHTIAKPFPAGDYSNFSFYDWAMSNSQEGAEDFLDSYRFSLPDDLPEFLESIPFVKSEYPEIGKCTNYVGDGEPTVHIPVKQLTDTAHVTLTMIGALNVPSTPAETEAEITAEPVLRPTSSVASDGPGRQTDGPSVAPVSPTTGKETPRTSYSSALPQTEIQLHPSIPGLSPATTSAGIGDIIASVIGLVPISRTTDLAQGRQLGTDIPSRPIETSARLPEITIGSSIVTVNSEAEFVIGSQTLTPGGPEIVQESTTYSLAPHGTAVAINGNVQAIEQPANIANSPETQEMMYATPITRIKADASSNFIIGSHTFSAGGSPITIDGVILSAPAFVSEIIIIQQTLPTPSTNTAFVTINGVQMTLLPNGDHILPENQTLSPEGKEVLFSGTTYSLPFTGSAIVVNGITSPLPTRTVEREAVTRSGTTYSASGSMVLIIVNGKTATEDEAAFAETLASDGSVNVASATGAVEATQRSTTAFETEPASATSSNNGGRSGKLQCWSLLALPMVALIAATR